MDSKRGRWLILIASLLATEGQASFHAWKINEIYSNADGKVQFIELTCDETGENALAGQRLYCNQGSQTNMFTFASNPVGDTFNRRLLLATSTFSIQPGAITPNYILPNNFLFLTNGRVNFANVDSVNYTNLPNDGRLSLVRSGSRFVLATNSPQNFAGHSGSLVPVRILRGLRSGTNYLVTFATATLPNFSITNSPTTCGGSVGSRLSLQPEPPVENRIHLRTGHQSQRRQAQPRGLPGRGSGF